MGRRHLLAFASLPLAVLAGLVWWASTTPLSQPCWPQPDESQPAPEAVSGRPSGRSGPLVIALLGDAMLGRDVAARMEANPGWNPWEGLESALRGVDLVALNLEAPITDQEVDWGLKRFWYRARPEQIARSLDLPVSQGALRLASLANNHALDQGQDGLLQTLAILDDAGWTRVGAGATARQAHAPAVLTTPAGVRVGVLAVADHCGCLDMCSWLATDARPGIWHLGLSWGETAPLIEAVASLRSAVDVVIVSLHMGPNYLPDGPAPWMRELARELVDAGADVVWGHSPHHALEPELVDGRLVVWGTGDVVHDYALRPDFDNNQGFVARITVAPDGTQILTRIPYRIKGGRPVLLR